MVHASRRSSTKKSVQRDVDMLVEIADSASISDSEEVYVPVNRSRVSVAR